MKDSTFVAPKIVRRGEGKCLELRGEARRQVIDGSHTNGVLALAHSKFGQGAGAPLHVHTREDEWFWIESGTFQFQIGEQTQQVQAGDFVFAPRFVPHSYTCESDEGGVLWVGVLDAGFENFFRELASQSEEGAPPTPATMKALAPNYGVHIASWGELEVPLGKPKVMHPDEGECLEAFGDCGRLLLTSQETQGRFCIAEGETPSFAGPPLHVHEREDEIFLIRRGCYEFQLGDARVQVGPGDVVFAPRGVAHCFRVVSNDPGCALVIATPGGFDGFFRQAALLFERGELNRDTIGTLSEQHAIRFLPPES